MSIGTRNVRSTLGDTNCQLQRSLQQKNTRRRITSRADASRRSRVYSTRPSSSTFWRIGLTLREIKRLSRPNLQWLSAIAIHCISVEKPGTIVT